MPRLMPNIITKGQTIFWIIWVNSMFLFTLILPHQASFIFPAKSALNIMGAFKKATGMGKSSEKPNKKDNNKTKANNSNNAEANAPPVANVPSKTNTDEKNTSKTPITDGMNERIEKRQGSGGE
tara:strand:- start:3498 stop:3869 length:372 start_codon:yes stop_codon:yes gene_type:complete